jgi:hypothetical protein
MNALQRRLSIALNLYSVSFKLEQVLQCFLHGRIVLDYQNCSRCFLSTVELLFRNEGGIQVDRCTSYPGTPPTTV